MNEVTEAPAAAEVAAPSPTQNALVAVRTQVAEIDRVSAGIAELERKYKGTVFDVSTAKGLAEAKIARAEIREPRFAVGRALEAAKRPLNDLKAAVAGRAAEIAAQLQALETPIDQQIKAEEDRKEAEKAARAAAERARVEGLTARLAAMQSIPLGLTHSTAAEIAEGMRSLESIEVGEDWEEFHTAAARARDETLASLRALHLKAAAREEYEAGIIRQRAELEAQQHALRVQQEEQARQEEAARVRREAEEAEARAEIERKAAEARAAQEAADAAALVERERLDAIAAEERRKADEAAAAQRASEQARLDAEAAELRRQREEQERIDREAREAQEAKDRAEREAAEAKAKAEREEASRIEAAVQAADKRMHDAADTMLDALRRVIAWNDLSDALPHDVLLIVENAIHEATGGAA